MTDTVAALLEGAVDMHYHSGPSPFPRRLDVVEAAQDFDRAGFRAVVMKSHHHSTVMEILALEPHALKDLKVAVYGGIALNGAVGGLNPMAVDLALKMGGKVVWFPTMSSGAHIAYHAEHHDSPFPTATVPVMSEREIDVLDDNGKLKPEVNEIIDIIAACDAVLSFGHMAPPQIDAVFRQAKAAGVDRLLINHPDFVLGVTHEQAAAYAREGVVIEHSIGMYNDQSPRKEVWPIDRLVEWVKVVGPSRTALGSDVGQLVNPTATDTYRRVVELLLGAGVPEADIKQMVAATAADLLGLAS